MKTTLALLAALVTPLPVYGQEAAESPAARWSEQGEVVVIQRLPYERAGRWLLTPYVGIVPNDPFVLYVPVGLRVGWFLNESFLLQLSGSYLDQLAVDRDLRDRVGRTGGERSTVDLQDHQVARLQLDASWTLLSAKGRWFGDDILYTRGHLLGGFGALLARDAEDALEPRAEGLFGFGLELHLGGATSLRAELRQMVFARKDGGALLPTEISLGVAWYPGGALEGAR